MTTAVYETDFPNLKLVKRGKVRDMYDVGDAFLMVASDRMSAFDVIMPNPIPEKGRILTQISLFWFEMMADLIPNHLISSDIDDYPESCKPYADQLVDRSMLVKKAEPLSIECVVRGYISGSGWKAYQDSGSVCGIALPEGLRESDRLPEPIFTPSTKEELGLHDINIDFAEAADRIGTELANKVKALSLAIYQKGAEFADTKGIIIADTKFEFGLDDDGRLTLIDEVLTPDSSRFWPADQYQPGTSPVSFDKQFVRDYLETLEWNKTAPGPELPDEIVTKTAKKYQQARVLLTE